MAKKKVISIGFSLETENVDYSGYDSDISLLDWDIILFKPDIDDVKRYDGYYQGKQSLDEYSSFRLKEYTEHWRREILQAFNAGKNIFLFLSDLDEVYIDSGKRNYSGTGRNQKTTIIVNQYNNYHSIPIDLNPIPTKGNSIKLI